MNIQIQNLADNQNDIVGSKQPDGENIKQLIPLTLKPIFKYIPINDIFKSKICSKPTFYKHLKAGAYSLYKFGSKSFVDFEEFNKAFHQVKLSNTK